MNEVAREYGGALFALAVEQELCDALLSETEAVQGLLLSSPDYIKLLASPEIPLAERERALVSAFGEANGYLLNFLRMMVTRGYARALPDALNEFGRLYRERFGIELAVIQSAAPLSDAEKERLVLALRRRVGKEISPLYRVEPELLGGIRVEVGGVLYDGTLRRRLDGLSDSLSELTL